MDTRRKAAHALAVGSRQVAIKLRSVVEYGFRNITETKLTNTAGVFKLYKPD